MAKKFTFDYDLIVIGSGPGGSAAATMAAKDGKRVAIIESNIFGGESPNYSDIPTKALLHAANLYDEFRKWFSGFLPKLPVSLQHPAVVADRTDPTGVHLDGLNLSRAWCMFEIAKSLPPGSPMAKELLRVGAEHARDALPHVISENYLGTHWLATFAVYMYFSR